MKAKITPSLVKELNPKDKPYEVVDSAINGFLVRVQPSGAKTYSFSYRRPDGRRTRCRIGTHPTITASIARKTAEKLAAQVVQGQDPQAQRQAARAEAAKAKNESLGVFIGEQYSSWAQAHQKRGDETLKLLSRKFSHLFVKRMAEITAWDIQKWRSEQKKAGSSPSTINRAVSTLKAVLNKAVEWGALDSNPLISVKPIKLDNSSRIRFLTPEEEKRIRVALDAREERLRLDRDAGNQWRRKRRYSQLPEFVGDYLKPMVLLALNTGMRRGELLALKWEDVDFARKQLIVQGVKAKSGHSRYIPLNSEAISILEKWCSNSAGELVFPNPLTGSAMTNIKSSWTKVRSMAQIADFRFHDLRHTFASNLVRAGIDLYRVKELLGHSTIQMTEKYAHLAPEHNIDAVERLVSGRAD
jgi:integrase